MIEVELSVGVRGPVTCTQLEGIVFRMVDREIWVVDWRRWSQDGKDGVKRVKGEVDWGIRLFKVPLVKLS